MKVHKVERDKNFKYKLKKFDQKKINKIIFNYKIKINKPNISKYRAYIESKIFNNEF